MQLGPCPNAIAGPHHHPIGAFSRGKPAAKEKNPGPASTDIGPFLSILTHRFLLSSPELPIALFSATNPFQDLDVLFVASPSRSEGARKLASFPLHPSAKLFSATLPPTAIMERSLASREYRDGVYIPAGLLVVGTLIVKRDWLPYAVLVALALGSWKFYSMRELPALV